MSSKAKGVVALILVVAVLANVGIFAISARPWLNRMRALVAAGWPISGTTMVKVVWPVGPRPMAGMFAPFAATLCMSCPFC